MPNKSNCITGGIEFLILMHKLFLEFQMIQKSNAKNLTLLPEAEKLKLLHDLADKIIAIKNGSLDLFNANSSIVYKDIDNESQYFLPKGVELNDFLRSTNCFRFGSWFVTPDRLVRIVFDEEFNIFIDYDFSVKDFSDNLFELVYGQWSFRRPDPLDFFNASSLFLQQQKVPSAFIEKQKVLADKIQEAPKIKKAIAEGKFPYYWDGFEQYEKKLLLWGEI